MDISVVSKHQMPFIQLLNAWLWSGHAPFILSNNNTLLECGELGWKGITSLNQSCSNMTYPNELVGVGTSVMCSLDLADKITSCMSELGQFSCYDGVCIIEAYKCDGVAHCSLAEDEENCKPSCVHNLVTLSVMECQTALCSGPVCRCLFGYHLCRLGGCVSYNYVCDCKVDCPYDSSDEENCNVDHCQQATEYRSSDFKCGQSEIPEYLRNNLIPNCNGDMPLDEKESIEKLLRINVYSTMTVNKTLCKEDHTPCIRGLDLCYPRSKTCIFDLDVHGQIAYCPNAAHLQSCSLMACFGMFKCWHNYCVPIYRLCDGNVDCPDGEDERNCTQFHCIGMLRCSLEHTCVPLEYVCDGIQHCPLSGDDEMVCSKRYCPSGCICNGNVYICLSSKLGMVPRLHITAKYLGLQDNYIQQYSDKLLYTRLLYLDMSMNSIGILPYGGFAHLKSLKYLLLQRNMIWRIEQNAFRGLDNLEYLDLSKNNFGMDFDESGLARPNQGIIFNFDLEYNENQCLFGGLQKLVYVDLSSTKLRALSYSLFCGTPSLQTIDLRRNTFKNIDDGLDNINVFTKTLNILRDSDKLCCITDRPDILQTNQWINNDFVE